MTQLNQTFSINSITFPNRIGMAPMCQYSAIDGFATHWHYVHYGSRAVGGVGLVLLEATAIVPEGRITPYDLGIWDDSQIENLKQISNFIHQQGSIAGIQIAHAGRKASHNKPSLGAKQLNEDENGWKTVAPSAIPFEPGELSPHELRIDEIKPILNQFKQAAIRVLAADFKVIEIHAAHGYLIHEFLSPISNKRTDEYGGCFENRIRFLLEVTDTIREVWPRDRALFVRLSITDWVDGGWSETESVELAKILKLKGVDLIDCSSGGNVYDANIPLKEMYQVPFSTAIRKIGIMSSAVGLITKVEQINEILEYEHADLVLLGRELLRNPYFVFQTLEQSKYPEQYRRAL